MVLFSLELLRTISQSVLVDTSASMFFISQKIVPYNARRPVVKISHFIIWDNPDGSGNKTCTHAVNY